MRRLIALATLFCAFAVQAQAPTLVDGILSQLARHTQVRATFIQGRENPALAEPQVSHGDLLFVVGHGMLWHTRAPFDDTLVLTASDTSRLNAQGKLERVRDGNRGVSQVSAMLQSLLAGQSAEAMRQFSITAEGTPAHWTLRFVPRQARMARVLAGITLGGDAFLQSIEVDLANGERTHITFSDTRDAGPLTLLEAKVLGVP
ncbi:LolA family protein [Luteibacter yeojuensis]